MTGLASVLAASVLGSLHCVGMCGGLIGFYASGATGQRQRPWLAHGAYHLTRLAAYSTLGAVAGQLGAGLDLAGRGLGLAQLGALLAGAVMLVWAALLWPRARQSRLLPLRRGPAQPNLWRRLEAHFGKQPARKHRLFEQPRPRCAA